MVEPKFTETTTVTNNKVRKPQLRYTNYFLTINTNKRFDQYSEEYEKYKSLFTQIVDETLNTSTLKNFVLFLEQGEWTENYINPGHIQKAIEIGEKSNCLHFHALIKIPHRSKVRINIDKLYSTFKQKINELFNDTKDIYYNGKYYYNSSDNLQDYLSKQQY